MVAEVLGLIDLAVEEGAPGASVAAVSDGGKKRVSVEY